MMTVLGSTACSAGMSVAACKT